MAEKKITKARMEKLAKVDALASDIESSKVVAILDMKGMPGRNLCGLRKALVGKARIKMSKKSIISFALKKTSKNELASLIGEQPALLLSDGESPFRLYKIISMNRSKAPARAGKVTTKDISVSAGDTGLPPGPVVGDLQKAGLPARIQGGKIVIDKDITVAKAGEAVKKEVAEALIKLGIEPFEIQLNVVGSWDGGLILKKDVLELAADEAGAASRLARAFSEALALALECAYPCSETIKTLVSRAGSQSRSLSAAAGIVTKENVGEMLALAHAQASTVSSQVMAIREV